MGKKTQTQEQTRSIGELTPEQQQMQQMMMQFAQSQMGQMGDMSQLAQGNLGQLTPEMERAITEAQAGARHGLEQRYQEGVRGSDQTASVRGIDGGSMEAVNLAMLGQQREAGLANLDSQAAQQRMALPFQLAQMQMGANQLLGSQFMGGGGANLNALLQQQLAQGTNSNTQTSSGGMFDQMLGLGSAFAGGGAFGAGGMFGRDE